MRLSDALSFGCRSCVLWGGGGLQARFFAHTSPGRAVSCVPGRGSGTCAVHGSSDSTGCSLCSSRSLPVHVLCLYSWGLVCGKSSCAMIPNEWVLCGSPMMVVPAVAGAGRATCFFLLPVCWCASPSVGVRRAWGNVNVYRGNIKSTAGSVEPPGSHSRQCQGAAAAIRQQHHVDVGDLSLVCIILQLAWAGDSEMFFIARMDRDVDFPEAVPSKSSSINTAAATIRWESVRS